MKVKRWTALVVSLCMSIGFAGCGGESGGAGNNGQSGDHTHEFTVKNTTDNYLKSAADCKSAAQYYYACSCGAKGTETYAHGEALGHDYKNGVCGACNDECAHTQTQWKDVLAADCLNDGEKNLVCQNCGETVDKDGIAAKGHIFENGTCTVCSADLWNGEADVSWYTGTETEYFIYTAEQLAGVSKLAMEGTSFDGITLTLKANIDLDCREWIPIATELSKGFMGTFNGGGYGISNLKITQAHGEYAYAGLFGCTMWNSTIKEVKLYGVDINIPSNYGYVGGLVGTCTGKAENCFVKGSVSVGASIKAGTETCCVGGAFGSVSNATNVIAACEVKNVFSDVPTAVAVERQIGGFAGSVNTVTDCVSLGSVLYDCQAEIDYDKVSYNYDTEVMIGGFSGRVVGQVTNCYASGDVTARGTLISYAGGFGGRLLGSISKAYATGDISVYSCKHTLGAGYTGGLIGEVTVDFRGTIEKSYATGDVTMVAAGGSDVGGLIGRNSTSYAGTISNVYATGKVALEGGRQCNAGGLVGYNHACTVEKAYATGSVTITNTDPKATTSNYVINCYAGGLMGYTQGNVTDAYASGNVTSTAYTDAEARVYGYAGGLIGYVKGSMVTVKNTYANGEVALNLRSNGGTLYSYAAGLIAYLEYSRVMNSFATGNVRRETNVEGYGAPVAPVVAANQDGQTSKVAQCYAAKGKKMTSVITGGEPYEINSEEYIVGSCMPTFADVAEMQSAGFVTGNLGWSADVWTIADGQFPTLTWKD